MSRSDSRPNRCIGMMALAASISIVSPAIRGDDGRIDYVRDIKPLLRERCYACHAGLKQEAGLRLDTAELVRRGGTDGPVVDAGNAAASRLITRIQETDLAQRMPPEGKPFTPAQVASLQRWIAEGATGPAHEQPERDPREHWAFRPPVQAAVPSLAASGWARNEIDALAGAELERRGLAPRREATKEALLRRVYLDLIGVPPTRDVLREFLADESDDAYERVVDRLLASPYYGQRWGRHWMDVWRYSDWFGRRMVPDVWNSAPQIWRWRDWIVASLNADAGYDRMLQAMLAADEIWPEDDVQAVATGFLIRNWYALNPNQWMRDNVEHTAKAFLGLTFNCAHCHDHKYDPISQLDYFRLRAIFEPIGVRQDRVAGEAEPGKFQEYDYSVLRKVVRQGMVRVYDKNLEAPTWFYTGGDERNRVKEKGPIEPGLPDVLGGAQWTIVPVELPARAWYPGLRPAIQETEITQSREAISQAELQLATARTAVAPKLQPQRDRVAAAQAEWSRAVAAARVAGRAMALSGSQSLILHAPVGRRVLSNSLPGLKAFPPGSALGFQLRIVHDAHVNFQLAKDNVKGLTAGYVAFEAGRILSYQPGGFTEFQVGQYDFASGQNAFEVRLLVQPAQDRCLLTVRSRADGKLLVDAVPVALNGWNPIGDAAKAVSFDARTGSVAAIDDFGVWVPATNERPALHDGSTPAMDRVFWCDFEPPTYTDGLDAAGLGGWAASPFGQEPATSRVATVIDSPIDDAAHRELIAAQQALASLELTAAAAEARLDAARRQCAAVEARVAADRARWEGGVDHARVEALVRVAAEAECAAKVAAAAATVLAKRQAATVADALPASDPSRAKAVQTAAQQLAEALAARDKFMATASGSPPAEYSPLSPVYGTKSSGRRRALAEWLTRRDHPLTARVAVNHIWLRHFHEPLVATVFDFGRNGAAPTHPALLDWLAVDLMESGWSMKRLHRQIVVSAAYRQSSHSSAPAAWADRPSIPSADAHDVDPENRYGWRMRIGRMEAEAVRDSLLSVAGLLDFRMGGQEIENSEALTTRRRGLYYSCHPEVGGKSVLGELFDAAEPTDCYRRTRSVTPQQALALTNSSLAHEVSGALAERIWLQLEPGQQGEPTAFITAAFEQILTRAPLDKEMTLCRLFLDRQAATIAVKEPATAAARARESLVRALVNHNDFVAIR